MKKAMRHGDVLLLEIDENEIPTNVQPVESGIVAEGEVTGHHHKFIEGAVVMKGFDEDFYVKVQKQATIVHQEHGDKREGLDSQYFYKDVPAGNYKVIIKREYRHGEQRRVLD